MHPAAADYNPSRCPNWERRSSVANLNETTALLHLYPAHSNSNAALTCTADLAAHPLVHAPRFAVVEVPPHLTNGTLPLDSAARLSALLLLLRTGGWATLVVVPNRLRSVQLREWLARDPSSGPPPPPPPRPLGPLPAQAPPPVLFSPPLGCTLPAVSLATAAASLAGADTILWLRHWDSVDTVPTHWPRYYGPSTPLDTVADLAPGTVWVSEGSRTHGPRVLDAFRIDAARSNGSRALTLCSKQAYPALQLGVCPSGDLIQTEGVGVVLGSAALSALAGSEIAPLFNVLAHRPAFPLLAGMAGLDVAAGLHLLSAAFGNGPFGARGWHAALTAPGSLCGNASLVHPRVSDPEFVAWPSHPHPDSFPVDSSAPKGHVLLKSAATIAISSLWLDLNQTVPFSSSWGPSSTLSSLSFYPPGAASPPYTGGGCRPAVPSRRDLLLALEFNSNWVNKNYALLHSLYDPYFPTVFMFGDTSTHPKHGVRGDDVRKPINATGTASPSPLPPFGWHDTARGVYCCRSGVPSDGHSAQVCMERVAPLAVGRVGVMWTADDALLHVWNLDKHDARRLWKGGINNWWLSAGRNYFAKGVEAWANAWHTPEMVAMQARNFEAVADAGKREAAMGANMTRPLYRIVAGTADVFYLPRAVVPLWGELLSENKTRELHQEYMIGKGLVFNGSRCMCRYCTSRLSVTLVELFGQSCVVRT